MATSRHRDKAGHWARDVVLTWALAAPVVRVRPFATLGYFEEMEMGIRIQKSEDDDEDKEGTRKKRGELVPRPSYHITPTQDQSAGKSHKHAFLRAYFLIRVKKKNY